MTPCFNNRFPRLYQAGARRISLPAGGVRCIVHSGFPHLPVSRRSVPDVPAPKLLEDPRGYQEAN